MMMPTQQDSQQPAGGTALGPFPHDAAQAIVLALNPVGTDGFGEGSFKALFESSEQEQIDSGEIAAE